MSGLNLWLIVDANRMWLAMPIPLLRIFSRAGYGGLYETEQHVGAHELSLLESSQAQLKLNCFAMKAAKMERSIDTQPRGLCKQEGISSPTRTPGVVGLQHPTERSPALASFPLSDLSNCASDRSCKSSRLSRSPRQGSFVL
ncbi:hypothetical protein GE21DRAFT_1349267 [Neurospora crassa]|nr:hypothetical protein B1D4.260 [imported] - Neurospora crassa [Neurospora crassa]KHE85336.1 hypothetical protein GE21DRAFT_1349267 [Neurospora crassa]